MSFLTGGIFIYLIYPLFRYTIKKLIL